MAHDVFISYASGDKSIADAACAILESRSIRCWIAPRDVLPGTLYAKSIVDAITSSRTVVLVFSAGANASSHVLREVERAVNAGIPVVPFRIEDVTPSRSMEYFISTSHWLDALTPPVEHHLHRLADVVVRLLSDGQVPPNKAAPRLASPYALLYELGFSIPALIDGSRKTPEAAQQLVITVSGLFTQLRLAQPAGWRHWGSDRDLDGAVQSSYGAMKALVSPLAGC